MNVLFIGDIIGSPGRRCLRDKLGWAVDRWQADLVIANGENAAGGFGLTAEVLAELQELGVDVLTGGNHTWDKKEVLELLEREQTVLRPLNYPPPAVGRGWCVATTAAGESLAVISLQGRVFMQPIDCPFRAVEPLIEELQTRTPCILVDFHAEATSEKNAMGWHLDGRVSAVIGTHTHVQTADERILPGGTAYITDAGMTGGRDSVIGMQREEALSRFLTGRGGRFQPSKAGLMLQGCSVTIDAQTGAATSIERVRESLD